MDENTYRLLTLVISLIYDEVDILASRLAEVLA
jgi:hypothetical protein